MGVRSLSALKPLWDWGFLHQCVDEQDYNDGTQNDHPIGNLNARYRRFLAKPFHGFPPQIGRLSLAGSSAPHIGPGPPVAMYKVTLFIMTKSKPTSLNCSLHSTTEVCRLVVEPGSAYVQVAVIVPCTGGPKRLVARAALQDIEQAGISQRVSER
jgi:hypothetical protein